MAKIPQQAPTSQVKARVIFSGLFGRMGEVVTLDKATADVALALGDIDTHPDAVEGK